MCRIRSKLDGEEKMWEKMYLIQNKCTLEWMTHSKRSVVMLIVSQR